MQAPPPLSYKRHRFPSQIITHAVWLYARFNVSLREVEEMLLKQGIEVSYETIRRWTVKFDPQISRHLCRRQTQPGDIWHLDDGIARQHIFICTKELLSKSGAANIGFGGR